MAYHKRHIQKGEVGETSKIQEELDELKDAEDQGSKIMALLELSDLIGAIELYIDKHYKSFSLEDLITMSELTKSSFEDKTRHD